VVFAPARVLYAGLRQLNGMNMDTYPELNNAPIAEAVVEIRVRMTGPVANQRYSTFAERLRVKYPNSKNIRFVTARLHFDSDDEVKNDLANALVGVRLDSEDGKWVVQAKNDGLTISRMRPYESWETLIAEVQGLWPQYVEIFAPEVVVRMGVRYINRIPLLGTDQVDLDSLLTVGPKIPPQLPQVLSQFLTRVVLPIEGNGIVLVISQSLQPEPVDSAAPLGHVVIDIDASCEEGLAVDSPDMWKKLLALRDAKNMAFFGSVTEPTWRRFI
jgi:uncharacterized protein (TIGR04255 family)